MTLACQQALALDRLLALRPGSAAAEPVHRACFRACRQIIALPWQITRAEALQFAATPGRRSLKIRLLQAYTGQVFSLSARHVDTGPRIPHSVRTSAEKSEGRRNH